MTSNVDDDLIRILQNLSLQLDTRVQGWKYVLGLTATEKGLQRILSAKTYIPFIVEYIHLYEKADSQTLDLAHKCLINISTTAEGSLAVTSSENDVVGFILNLMKDIDNELIEQNCYLLANVSSHQNICKIEDVSVRLSGMLDELMKGFCSLESGVRENYKFLALVFANISNYPEGKKLLTTNDSFLISLLTCQNPGGSDIRRLGVALTLRNCCSERSIHKKLLEDFDILPALLLPLMGSEEFEEEDMDKFPVECQFLDSSKEREKLPQIRKALVHALCLLCYTEEGWNYLKTKGVYYIAREFHTWEQDTEVNEALETLITYLFVIDYQNPNPDAQKSESSVIPEESDILQDIPDLFV